MAANQLRYEVNLTIGSVECCNCGHLIFMSSDFETRRRRDHKMWFCTSCGTTQGWQGKSDIERLRDDLAAEQKRKMDALAQANELRASLAKEQEAAARARKRAKHGVCPCCHRTVAQMARHMKTKHPDFAANGRGE